MRSVVVLWLVVFALAAAACASDAGDESHGADASGIPSTGDQELARVAADAVAAHGIPAVAVARVGLDAEVRIGVAGTRDRGDDTPVTVDSRFHLGSDTKAMTAVLVAQLVESGDVHLDAHVSDVLQDAQVDSRLHSLTIREVLGHRTGLADDLDLRALHAATDPVAARREAVYEALRGPGGEPGSYAYANVNYMLAGVLVEELTGRPWTDVMEEQIFTRLGMTTCGFGAPTGALDPLGHTADGTPIPQDAPVTDNPAAMGPAGTVHCSIGDWAKFVNAMLHALTGTDSDVLSAATAADLFAGTETYVAGWLRSEKDDEVTYGHDGSNTLWYARAVLRPGQSDAVLVAVNTGEEDGVRAVDQLTSLLLSD
jgi:CubicO group peptidase (beta-lactamase class C family)